MRGRFTDDDIVRILSAGDSGLKIADLCAAEHITPKTYYQWKVRYGDLTADELRQRRLRERLFRHAVGALAMLVALGGVYAAVATFGGAQSQPPAATPARPQTPPVPRAGAHPPGLAPSASPAAAARPVVSAETALPSRGDGRNVRAEDARPADPVAPAAEVPLPEDILAADPEGSTVQIAAVAVLADARKARDRLIGGGYPAYLTRAVNGQGGDVYRIRVGPFTSRAAADEAARRLEGDGYGRPWIVK